MLRPGAPQDPLLVRLGDLFLPRKGRDSDYRPSALAAGAASLAAVEARLTAALDAAPAGSPLLLYFATHGEQGEHARDNAVLLWGGGALSAARLAELHDAHPRPLRVVNASCFSGGFAELAFERADEKLGAVPASRAALRAVRGHMGSRDERLRSRSRSQAAGGLQPALLARAAPPGPRRRSAGRDADRLRRRRAA